MRVEISGLQIASPDERSIIVQGRPLWIQLELINHHPQPVEVVAVVDFADVRGVSRLNKSAPVTVPLGCSWVEMRLPPDSLPLGRYSLSVAIVGDDFHRSRRLVDVLQVPLGLPPHLCDPWGEWTLCQGKLPRDHKVWRVEQLRVQAGGGEPLAIPPGAPVELVMRVDTTELPPDLMVRLQVLSLGGELLVGTNTKRWGLHLDEAQRWVLRASFEALNLAQGHYLATVGLWEDEWASEAYQARHGYFELFLEQASGHERLTSRLELDRPGACGPDHDHDAVVQLLGEGKIGRGEWVCLRLVEHGPAQGRAWMEQHGREVAGARTPALVCDGRTVWNWKLRALVPPGEYTLCYTRWRSGEMVVGQPARFPLRVTNYDQE